MTVNVKENSGLAGGKKGLAQRRKESIMIGNEGEGHFVVKTTSALVPCGSGASRAGGGRLFRGDGAAPGSLRRPHRKTAPRCRFFHPGGEGAVSIQTGVPTNRVSARAQWLSWLSVPFSLAGGAAGPGPWPKEGLQPGGPVLPAGRRPSAGRPRRRFRGPGPARSRRRPPGPGCAR